MPYTYPQIKGIQNMYENEKMYKAGSTFNGKTIEVNNSQKQRQIVRIFLCKAIFRSVGSQKFYITQGQTVNNQYRCTERQKYN